MADFFHDRWEAIPDHIIENISERTGYSDQEIYQAHYSILSEYIEGEDQETRERLWDEYVEAMVENGDMSYAEFFEDLGIFEADFDWEAWREAMGY